MASYNPVVVRWSSTFKKDYAIQSSLVRRGMFGYALSYIGPGAKSSRKPPPGPPVNVLICQDLVNDF